jgi:peroxiredoxin
MNPATKRSALVVATVALAFTASFAVAGPSRAARLHRLEAAIRQDPAHTVCMAAPACMARDPDYTLLVFFSAEDCAVCLYDTAILDSLYRAVPRERLNVIGIASGYTPDEARRFARASGISYPLYVAPERLADLIRDPRPPKANKPEKVLLDRNGAVLGTWRSRTTVSWHSDDMRWIRARAGL